MLWQSVIESLTTERVLWEIFIEWMETFEYSIGEYLDGWMRKSSLRHSLSHRIMVLCWRYQSALLSSGVLVVDIPIGRSRFALELALEIAQFDARSTRIVEVICSAISEMQKMLCKLELVCDIARYKLNDTMKNHLLMWFWFFKAIIFAVVYSSGRKRVWSSPSLDITLDGYVAYVTILRSYYRSYSNKRTVRLNFGIERLKIGNFCTIIHWDTFSHVAKILNGLGNLFDNHLPISLIW